MTKGPIIAYVGVNEDGDVVAMARVIYGQQSHQDCIEQCNGRGMRPFPIVESELAAAGEMMRRYTLRRWDRIARRKRLVARLLKWF